MARHEGCVIGSAHDDESLDWELLPGRNDALKVPDDPLMRRELAEMLPALADVVRASDAFGKPLEPFPTESFEKKLKAVQAGARTKAESFLFPKVYLDRATDLPFCREATSRLDSDYSRALIEMKLAEEYYQVHRPTLAEGPAGLAELKKRSLKDRVNIRWSSSFQLEELALGFELGGLRRLAARASAAAQSELASALDERAAAVERALGIFGRASAPPVEKTGRRRKDDLRKVLQTVKRRVRSLDPDQRLAALKACGWEKPLRKLSIEAVALCLIGADRFGWTFTNMKDHAHEERIGRLRETIMSRDDGRRSPHKPEKTKKRFVH